MHRMSFAQQVVLAFVLLKDPHHVQSPEGGVENMEGIGITIVCTDETFPTPTRCWPTSSKTRAPSFVERDQPAALLN